MKNNLVALKYCNTDVWPGTHNDFLQVVITNKMEEGKFVDVINEIEDILERDYFYEEDEDVDDSVEGTEPFYYDKLKENSPPIEYINANSLLYAGYVDCMEEAIRFLVEEENISPEHPIVENLKAHLEKSKDRILQSLSFEGVNNGRPDSPLSNIFLETFQNCRDSG